MCLMAGMDLPVRAIREQIHKGCHLILTTGGTGVALRDVTPEAVREIALRELPGFGEIMRISDGPLALLPCVSHKFYRRCEDCRDERACAIRRVMAVVRREVSDVLDRTTLADALDGSAPQLRELVELPGSGRPGPAPDRSDR